MSSVEVLVAGIQAFLPCRTPDAWVAAALQPYQEPTLLIDHANCEKKAAATALALMHRYTDNPVLLNKMSRLAREELRHFEQVIKIMDPAEEAELGRAGGDFAVPLIKETDDD